MANIGAIGDVVFSVSNERVMTFDKYRRKSAHRYETHKMMTRENVLESLGNDTEEITLEVIMMRAVGVDPATQILKLRQMLQQAEPNYLIIGANVINASLWVITDLDEQAIHWNHLGEVITAKCQLTLKQYGERGSEIVAKITGGAKKPNRFWSGVAGIAKSFLHL